MRTLALALLLLAPQDVVKVRAVAETDPVPTAGDSADDPAIWVHPLDPALSLVIGDDKNGGLAVYGLDGRQLQFLDRDTALNNVDVRTGFSWRGQEVDLVAVGNESDGAIRCHSAP